MALPNIVIAYILFAVGIIISIIRQNTIQYGKAFNFGNLSISFTKVPNDLIILMIPVIVIGMIFYFIYTGKILVKSTEVEFFKKIEKKLHISIPIIFFILLLVVYFAVIFTVCYVLQKG